jgi:hypothetical protein
LATTQEPRRGADQPDHLALNGESADGHWMKQHSTAASTAGITPLDHDQLASAVAEIEQASAMLRRSEPALEAGIPSPPVSIERRSYWSVWILIGAIWISATLVVASATGAILYLLG